MRSTVALDVVPSTVHALRHSFGAHLRMAGVSLADIADLLGHKDLATTQIYAKVQQEHLRAVIGKLTGLVPPPETDAASLKRVTQDNQRAIDGPKLLTAGQLDDNRTGMAGCLGRFPQLAHPCGVSSAAVCQTEIDLWDIFDSPRRSFRFFHFSDLKPSQAERYDTSCVRRA